MHERAALYVANCIILIKQYRKHASICPLTFLAPLMQVEKFQLHQTRNNRDAEGQFETHQLKNIDFLVSKYTAQCSAVQCNLTLGSI
jgi:hypothetical protein